jgi:hypothetical protein
MSFPMVPVVIVIGGVAAMVTSRWVFGPLDLAAEERDCPTQFMLADVLCVFVLVQFALGVVHWEARDTSFRDLIIADVALSLLVALGWWCFVQKLSRAGIRVVWQRCALLLFVLPITGISWFVITLLPFVAVDLFGNQRNVSHDVSVSLAAVLAPGIIYGLGRFTRAIVASAAEK